MKIIVVSDLHIHPYRLCSRDGGKDRLHDGLGALRQSLEMAQSHACPWVFCGDMKLPKLSWPQEALTGILELFESFDVPKLMLPGNHDGDASHIGGSGLAPFAKHARVIEKPSIIEWQGPTMAVLPWQAQRTTGALFAEARRFRITTLVSHGFLAGVLLGPDDHRLPGVGLRMEDFGVGDPFTCVILGDIHKGQRLDRTPPRPPTWVSWESPRPKGPWIGDVLYPGSPYQQNWGERNDGPKGALLVDLDTGFVELLPIQAPRHLLIDVPSLKFGDLEKLVHDAPTWEGHFVRVRVPDQILDKQAARGVIEKLRTLSRARWFHVEPVRTRTTETRTPMHAGMAPAELLRTYLDARPFDGDVPSETLLKAGLRLLEQEA